MDAASKRLGMMDWAARRTALSPITVGAIIELMHQLFEEQINTQYCYQVRAGFGFQL